jgi:hypothetical protein
MGADDVHDASDGADGVPGRFVRSQVLAAVDQAGLTWAWQLNATDGATRLVNRIRAVHDWHAPLSALLSVALSEFGDFAMNRQMMRGIRTRAESVASGPRPGSAVEEVDE